MENILEVASCMQGMVRPLKESKDRAFAQGLSGDGVLITPTSSKIYAPFDGQIVIVFETKHAIILRSQEGLALVIHIGTQTRKLKGKGFSVFVEDGAIIKKGDLLLEMDFAYLDKIQYNYDTHILFPSLGIKKIKAIHYGSIEVLKTLCVIE